MAIMIDRHLAAGQASHRDSTRLTRSELRVLLVIARGHSSQRAADILVLSRRTIDSHLAQIYAKLGVGNRLGAIRVASRLGMLPFEPQDSFMSVV